jgi:hypothetical protein
VENTPSFLPLHARAFVTPADAIGPLGAATLGAICRSDARGCNPQVVMNFDAAFSAQFGRGWHPLMDFALDCRDLPPCR